MRVEIYGDANQKTVSGPTVQFTADDAAPVTDLKAQITPSIAGYSAVTIAANGQNTNVSLTKSVYGGSADITTGVVTETHGGGAYNPTAVPSDLSSKIVSATTARSASGSVASFNCSLGEYPMSALTAAINPVQDLHGYDHPWPGGGGKNLMDTSGLVNGVSAGVTYTRSPDGGIICNGTSSATGTVREFFRGSNFLQNGQYTLTGGQNVGIRVNVYNSGGTLLRRYTAKGEPVTVSIDENVAEIAFSIGNVVSGTEVSETVYPMLEAGTSATSWEPYANICPITGWTGAKVTRTGVNVWDEEWEVGNINTVGVDVDSTDRIRTKNYVSVIPGAEYYIKTPIGLNLRLYGRDKEFIGLQSSVSGNYTIPSGVFFVRFVTPGSSYVGGTTYNNDISVNYPATDHNYHAYSGTTYAITFPAAAGTVYGGTLDVVNGVLTVTWKKIALGDYGFGKTGDNNFYISTVTDFKTYGSSVTRYGLGISDTFKFITNNWNTENNSCTCYLHTGYNGYRIFIHSEEHENDTPTAFRTWLQSINAQFVYELTTPITYQLTPQEVSTLLGTNNLWADTGDVTVSYRDGLLSNVSGIMTNSTALTTGENITYTLSQERTFQIPGTVIRTVVGNNVMTASTGNISVTWSSHWFDITPWIAYQGLTFSRNDVDAPDAGRDMSGYMHRGRVGVKEKMNITTVQLTRAQSSTLQTLLYPETIQVRVTPYPRTNTSHTMSMYTNNVKTTYVIHRKNGEDLQSLTFPLIEN